MNAGPPGPPDTSSHSQRAVRAAWTAVSGVILGTCTAICLAVGVISGEQAVALALPAVLLVLGGLIVVAMPDPATCQRRGFGAGFLASSLRHWWIGKFRG